MDWPTAEVSADWVEGAAYNKLRATHKNTAKRIKEKKGIQMQVAAYDVANKTTMKTDPLIILFPRRYKRVQCEQWRL